MPDPKVAGRELGWVTSPHAYAGATHQLAIRKRKPKDTWLTAVIVSTLSDPMLCGLTGTDATIPLTPQQRAMLIVQSYDLRGGGAETQNKSDKQGLGLAKRNKRAFAAQEMLVLLAQLAHNLVLWTRNGLAQSAPALAPYGIQRMVRDVLHIPGQIQFDAVGKVRVTLSETHPLAQKVACGFSGWFPEDKLSVNLGKI